MLPSSNFLGVVALEAQYADCQALCNRLHKDILHPDGLPVLFLPDCEAFWTQHGDRATLPTLGAVDSSLPVEWLDELGHWSSKSSHAYVRTQLQKVAKIQSTIAAKIRAGSFTVAGIGEEDLYASWAGYMVAHGASQARAVGQASRLAEATARRFALTSCVSKDRVPDVAEALPPQIDDPLLMQVLPEREAAYRVDDLPVFAVGTFVVSIQRKSNFRRLHIVGACSYRAGIDFARYEAFGLVMPDPSSYTAQCKHCFRDEAEQKEVEGSSSASSSSSESTSDSS